MPNNKAVILRGGPFTLDEIETLSDFSTKVSLYIISSIILMSMIAILSVIIDLMYINLLSLLIAFQTIKRVQGIKSLSEKSVLKYFKRFNGAFKPSHFKRNGSEQWKVKCFRCAKTDFSYSDSTIRGINTVQCDYCRLELFTVKSNESR